MCPAALGPRLVSLSASGAFQLTAAGLEVLAACPQLEELALDETTLQDEGLEALGWVAYDGDCRCLNGFSRQEAARNEGCQHGGQGHLTAC